MATKRAASKTPAPKKQARRPGRVLTYTPKLFAAICEGLAAGKSLVTVCAAAGMPSRATVHRWIAENPALKAQYEAARDDQADYYAEEVLDIADGLTAKRRPPTKSEIAAARVQIDARKWYAGKIRPKKWGDKIDVNVDAKVSPMESMSDAELDDEIRKADEQLRAMGVGVAVGIATGVAAAQATGDDSAAG